MAGERKGKAYEGLVLLAIEHLVAEGALKGTINWNVPIPGLSVEPDLWVGDANGRPSLLLLVTHSSSHSSSHKKFWRNVGEIAEAKLLLAHEFVAGTVVFDVGIKETLRLLEKTYVDCYLEAGGAPYGKTLVFLAEKAAKSRVAAEEMLSVLREAVSAQSATRDALVAFAHDLQNSITSAAAGKAGLWVAARLRASSRRPPRIPRAKNTTVRRGLAKLLLSSNPELLVESVHKPIAVVEEHLVTLGIVARSIAGCRLVDSEVREAVSLLGTETSKSLLEKACGLDAIESIVRPLINEAELAPVFSRYVVAEWKELLQGPNLFRHLVKTHMDKASALGMPAETYVRPGWLFQLLIAVLKAASGRRQAFGYSVLLKRLEETPASHVHGLASQARAYGIEGPYVLRSPRTIEYGLRDWFFGDERTNFDLKPFELYALSDLMAGLLAETRIPDLPKTIADAQRFESADLIENVLIGFNQFQPLKWLIIQGLEKAKVEYEDVAYYPTPMYEQVVAGGQRLNKRASSTSVIQCEQTLIRWISVTDEGRDHKRKEFGGRGAVLPVAWNADAGSFVPRGRVSRLLLLVDGTFRDADLNVLGSLGWDGIYYPDEIDDLLKAVV